MEELVLEYLNKNYDIILSSFSSYKYVSRVSVDISSNTVLRDTCQIFGSGAKDEEIETIVNGWTKEKIGLLSVKINNIKYQYYSKFGYDIKTVDQLNKLILQGDASTQLCT
jgi:hypothetical protein